MVEICRNAWAKIVTSMINRDPLSAFVANENDS